MMQDGNGTAQFIENRESMEIGPKLRVVLVQEHEVLREGLEILLGRQSEFAVIASFDNVAEALLAIPKLQPDLVVTDWQLAGVPATDFLSELRRLAPACKKLVLSAQESEGACARP